MAAPLLAHPWAKVLASDTQILHNFHCIAILTRTGDSEGCSSLTRRMKQSAVLLRVPFGLFRLFSTWTNRVQCQEKRILQFQNPLVRLEARCSASINGISLCGLGGQKLYNGENAAFWVKCGPILELLRTWVIIFIKIQKFFKITVHDSSCMHWLYCLFPEHHQSIHSILPAVSLRSCLCVTFN